MPKYLKKTFFILSLRSVLLLIYNMIERRRTVNLKIIHTSDVHGNFFLWDFVRNRTVKGSLSRVYAYVQSLRQKYGTRLLLTDGGDILQGSPVVYFNNLISANGHDLTAELMNYMHYDVGTIGNHDIETGHKNYDRWASLCQFPIVCANLINEETSRTYFPPYCIIERAGVRIAVFGMTTPAVPNWLPKSLWSGLAFTDMVSCARHWAPIILKKEKPDILIGLFHSGKEGGIVTPDYAENAAFDVARQVEGFDLVLYGHDHIRNCEEVTSPNGNRVLCSAPSGLATTVAEIDISVEMPEHPNNTPPNSHTTSQTPAGKKRLLSIKGKITDLSRYETQQTHFMQRFFSRYIHNTEYNVSQKIGTFLNTIDSRDAYFGSSAFVDLVHKIQLITTGAQISFASPVTFSAKIRKGDVRIRDIFNLYRYDDVLYTLRLTGKEIVGALEMSYSQWIDQMHTPLDHVVLMDYVLDEGTRLGFKYLAYNFDSAAGIRYTVDVTKPAGSKITVESMADGSPFNPDAFYSVVTNSYRGSGGGELLTKGAGIKQEELASRIIATTTKDLRTCIKDYILNAGEINAVPLNQWRLVPDEWAKDACARDRQILFGSRHQTFGKKSLEADSKGKDFLAR